MADLIKIKGGSGAVPTLQDRELAYSKSEKALYIGTENGNVKIGGADTQTETIIAEITRLNEAITEINARLDALENPSE